MVNKYSVTTPGEALAYMVDCTLATVEDMACKKSRPKWEFERQIGIAQDGVDWMRRMDVDFSSTRAQDVVANHHGNVRQWADRFMPR